MTTMVHALTATQARALAAWQAMPRTVEGWCDDGPCPNTDRMPALRALMRNAVCAYCGESDNLDTIAHAIPAGPRTRPDGSKGRKGYRPYIVMASHAECNDIIGDLDHTPFIHLIPDNAFLVWDVLTSTPRVDRSITRNKLIARGWPTMK